MFGGILLLGHEPIFNLPFFWCPLVQNLSGSTLNFKEFVFLGVVKGSKFSVSLVSVHTYQIGV